MVLIPKGGNDKIMTPDNIAIQIVNHFKPHGKILEPCRGEGAFIRALEGNCDWCEISEGRDFLEISGHWDWIITNPPWSKFRKFLQKGMEVSDNIVFLSFVNAWFMKARMRDMKKHNFGLIEVLTIDTGKWISTGLTIGAGWIRRGWEGGVHFSS